MATNTLAGVNLARISQLTLDTLMTEGIPLTAFVTDFSGEIKDSGDSVTTRFASVPTTQDFGTSKATSNSVLTSRVITLNDYRGVSIGFKDTELSFTDTDLVSKFIQPAVSALVDYVINKVLLNVTAANFAASIVKTAAQFDADVVADLAQSMTTLKVLKAGRGLILKPTYYGNLAKDNAIQAVYASGSSSAIREHQVPRVHGFDAHEYNGAIPANAQSLEGIAFHNSALCLAARAVATPPPGTWYGKVKNLIVPGIGLPIQIREHYDGNELVYQISTLFGTQVGVGSCLVRIASA